jgi:transcriptional pleiotropic regulator of transition state genes
MKATGIVRRIDELGRVVIPKEIRRTLRIRESDPLEIFMDGQRIVLQKYQPACLFCDGTDNIVYFQEKRICATCLAKLKEQF